MLPQIKGYQFVYYTFRYAGGFSHSEQNKSLFIECESIMSLLPIEARRKAIEHVQQLMKDIIEAEEEHVREGGKFPPLGYHLLVNLHLQSDNVAPVCILSQSNYKEGKEKYTTAMLLNNRSYEAHIYQQRCYETGGDLHILTVPGDENQYLILPDDVEGYNQQIQTMTL